MNLLFVISSLRGGGAEGVICTLANKLTERGHDVTLITTQNCHIYPINNKVNVIEACEWEYDTFVGNIFTRIYKKIANRFLDFFYLRKIIKEIRPDLVMSFLLRWLFFLILLCKGRIPMVFADRNAAQYKFARNDFLIRHILFRFADVVQVMSRYDKAWLRNRYKHIVPMPNPLRFTPISDTEYVNSFDKRKHILACGRLVPQKGFDKLIESFSMIANKYPEWNIDICGEDSDTSNYSGTIRKIVANNHLESRVNFLGFLKNVDCLMRSHSIFCLSSKHEGFPNVLSEAMANGMACVSFDIVTGPSEIIVDNVDGVIVENQNVEALAEALSMLIDSRELRFSYGLHAIENIKRFNCDNIVTKWEKMFITIIKDYYGKN